MVVLIFLNEQFIEFVFIYAIISILVTHVYFSFYSRFGLLFKILGRKRVSRWRRRGLLHA